MLQKEPPEKEETRSKWSGDTAEEEKMSTRKAVTSDIPQRCTFFTFNLNWADIDQISRLIIITMTVIPSTDTSLLSAMERTVSIQEKFFSSPAFSTSFTTLLVRMMYDLKKI